MHLPQTAEYALRAVIHLARDESGDYVGVADISRASDVPGNYLSKVLGQLVRAEVLESSRGPNGGFRLARDAADLTLGDVVGVFTPVVRKRCLLGSGVCGQVPDCAVHELWAPVALRLQEFLRTTTIADLARSKSLIGGSV